MHDPSPSRSRCASCNRYLAVLAVAIILALLLLASGGPLDRADHVAYAVCHRIGERSFHFGGRQLPLCARCSGTYLGASVGLAVLLARGRGRASRLPETRFLAVLGLFVLLWAADGLNSYLSWFPGLPHLYEPSNLLRLATGALQGTALAVFLLPMFNLALWVQDAIAPAVVQTWGDMAWLLVGAGTVVGLVGSEWPPLLYPLALASGGAVVGLLGCVNIMLLAVLLRRDGQARCWQDVAALLAAGIALALIELTAVAALRAMLTEALGLPF